MEADEIRERAERSLYFFVKGVMGWADLVKPLHTDVCSFLEQPEPLSKVLLLPRNCFKTTIATCLVLHMLIQPKHRNLYFPGRAGTDTRILYVAENATLAERRTMWIKRQLESHALLRGLWPHVVWPDLNMIPNAAKWTNIEFTVPRPNDYPECTVVGIGVGGASTGGHFDVRMKDDLISIAAAQSPDAMLNAIEWNNESQSLINDPLTSREYYFGTRWANYDLYEDVKKRYPHTAFFERSIIWQGTSLFPSRFPPEVIEDLRIKQGDLFYLNYMNTASGTGQTAFDLGTLRLYHKFGDEISFEDVPELDLAILANADKLKAVTPNVDAKPDYESLGTSHTARPDEKETGASISAWYKRERARLVREGQGR